MRSSSAGSRNDDIEVLRAIAISFTLISHLVWGIVPKLGTWGRQVFTAFQFWTGVDLFFAISGFIITTSLLRGDPAWSAAAPGGRRGREFFRVAKPFWIRRAFRLLPSAWLWIAITLAFAALCNVHGSLGHLEDNLSEATAAVFNVANFYYYHWFALGNFDYGSLGVYWSLSLEEQFYLIFPALLFFLPRRLLVGGLALVFVAQTLIPRPDGFTPHHPSLFWFVRTDALILGVLLAFWRGTSAYARLEPRWLRRRWLAAGVMGTLVLLLAALPAIRGIATFSTGLVALISGALVFIASYDRGYVLGPLPFKRAWVWAGTRSYSIYLIHTLCRSLILELKRSAGIAEGSFAAALWTVFSLALILLLSELNYRFIERRFRAIGRRVADGRRVRERQLALEGTAPASSIES